MKFLKYLMPVMAFMASTQLLFAQIETDTMGIEAHPLEELQELERREAAEASRGELSITGNLRFKWTPQSKKNAGYWTRGTGASNPVSVPTAARSTVAGAPITAPTNLYVTEANIYLDFDGARDWMEAQVQFKNTLGIVNDKISVTCKKAWGGYSFWKPACSEFYVELGHKGLSDIFDSRIQFDSVFDGILFSFENESRAGQFKIDGGPCIVDYTVNHYAWIGEAALDKIVGSNFFAKYALAWWRKKGVDENGVHDTPQFRFVNSQWMLGYNIPKQCLWGQPVCIYGAYEINHAAQKVVTSNYTRANQAWYLAIEYGRLGSPGDYLIDLCYQDVGYQAVPNFDNSGIGRGNSGSRGDLPVIVDPTDSNNFSNPQNVLTLPASEAEGNSNYRGLELRTFLTLTKQFIFKQTVDYSWARDSNIGGSNRFFKFEWNVVYEF